MPSGKKVPILIVMGLILVASGVGAWTLGFQSLSATVNEPISLNNPSNFRAGMSMAPGQSVQSSVDIASQNDSQTIVVRLENWNDTLNQTGSPGARNESGGYISKMEIGSARLTFDLLNDGKANYHFIDSGETLPNTFNMTVPGDTAAGNITYKVSYARGSIEAGSDLVKMHLSQGATSNCGDCHTQVDTGASISQAHESLGVANESCTNCHGASMADIHMDCTAGCHGTKTDVQIHPVNDDPTTNDYTCTGGGCHGGGTTDSDALAHTHRNWTKMSSSTNGFCPQCHGSTNSRDTKDGLMGLHSTFSEECVTCHGVSSDQIHTNYNDNDCSDCHS